MEIWGKHSVLQQELNNLNMKIKKTNQSNAILLRRNLSKWSKQKSAMEILI